MSITLQAQKREVIGKKVKVLRREGLVTGEVYGKKFGNLSIQIDAIALRSALKEAGTTEFITLEVEGEKAVEVLAKEIIRGIDGKSFVNADFIAIDMDSPMKVVVPVKLTGESPLIAAGGILVAGATAIEVEALPKLIPSKLVVDTSVIADFSEPITVATLALPEGVKAVTNAATTVAAVAETRASRAAKAAAKAAAEAK